MKITVAAVGRLKAGPERDLLERYRERFDALARTSGLGPIRVVEVPESKAVSAAVRCEEEAAKLRPSIGEDSVLIRLDATGRALTSAAFAADLGRRRDAGARHIVFVIGGPDGHGAAFRGKDLATLSLGAMTLPHGLARVVLAEQLYRAATILIGHPYHRA
jgi:23S rRNA (pseudouridine1915-N3)-methyltransferase